jgi:hypothetical protein
MPDDAPRTIRHVAKRCWSFEPDVRPSMRKIIKKLRVVEESSPSTSFSQPLDEIDGIEPPLPVSGTYEDLLTIDKTA